MNGLQLPIGQFSLLVIVWLLLIQCVIVAPVSAQAKLDQPISIDYAAPSDSSLWDIVYEQFARPVLAKKNALMKPLRILRTYADILIIEDSDDIRLRRRENRRLLRYAHEHNIQIFARENDLLNQVLFSQKLNDSIVIALAEVIEYEECSNFKESYRNPQGRLYTIGCNNPVMRKYYYMLINRKTKEQYTVELKSPVGQLIGFSVCEDLSLEMYTHSYLFGYKEFVMHYPTGRSTRGVDYNSVPESDRFLNQITTFSPERIVLSDLEKTVMSYEARLPYLEYLDRYMSWWLVRGGYIKEETENYVFDKYAEFK